MFTQDKLIIKSAEGDALVVAEREGQLFKARIKEIRSSERSWAEVAASASIAENDELDLWHKRFGHVHNRRLIKMAKDNAVEGLRAI